jgi:anti-sigma factor RsiW
MKPCDNRWSEELADHALGAPANAALKDHLATCAVCNATLQKWKTRMGQVDAGIRQLAADEPPAHTQSRVMAEVRARGERSRVAGWGWRMAAVCGVVLVVATFVLRWKVQEARKETAQMLAAASAIGGWKSPTDDLLRSASDHWLHAPPRLGEYFYPLDTQVPKKEKRKP